ncbi:MAG: B12-binding domain-containing radical SAM protein [Candidatus Bathyarchaeota archaeon]|nr:B12-binding domain-containing radical SAM protein [Candidatus Bathyarchaeota archaeon]MDH5788397.1 B12-binding domain-containing radical SAM protein [Candidatus Bathyarchaeota archaeon]
MLEMKILFVEPPKDVWFVMGEYLPPPYGIIQLAAFLEKRIENIEIEVLDCNAKQIDWHGLERHIESFNPDVVASSSLATCNTYAVVRTLEAAKKVDPGILTVTGGQHFTATAEESLGTYPEIDVIVRGEGEETLAELAVNADRRSAFSHIMGISFRHEGKAVHNPPRPLIEDLEKLPYPGYHLLKDIIHKYHFAAMAGRNTPYALVEGSRGCPYECTFCTQWRHWQGKWRLKSAKRIADEIEFCYTNFGSRFIWLTDDNFGAGSRARDLAEEIIERGITEDLMWFVQARCDDVINNKEALPRLRESGLNWVLLGVENSELSTLQSFRKGIKPQEAKDAVRLLKENDIFAHAMFIIGERRDTSESIARVRAFANELNPDFSLFSVLTPFPGTQVYEEARRNGWIEDFNWSHYDMIHAIMPTETLSTKQVQEELYECYRSFYGSWSRRFQGLFSSNKLKRRIYSYMARRGIIAQLKKLF